MQTLSNAVQVAHTLVKMALPGAKVIVDATAGKGSDTLFLAENMSKDAVLYAFDIQEEALLQAKNKVSASERTKDKHVEYICDSHDKLATYVKAKIDLAIFNLGYLPGGNHAVTTKCDTTMNAIKIILAGLSLNGCMAVVVYPGHEEGLNESQKIRAFMDELPRKYFTAGWYKMVNHNINAPALCWVEKVGE